MINTIKELDAILIAAQEKCALKLSGALFKDSDTLYHYTDLDAGLSILKQSSLRFSDIKYCNDPGEFEGGLKILNRITDSVFAAYFNKSPAFMLIMDYIRHLLNLATSFEWEEEKILSKARAKLAGYTIKAENFEYTKSTVFVCCFSERQDDLRQWLPYANDAKGVALGFKGIKDDEHFLTIDSNSYAVKASYAPETEKEKYVENIFEKAYEIFSNMNPDLVPHFLNTVYRSFLVDIISCKSENYRDEQEWRLVRVENTEGILGELNFRTKDNIIRPYIDVPFIKESLLEVRLGPKMEENLNTHAFNKVLKKYGYTNAKVDKSKIDYR